MTSVARLIFFGRHIGRRARRWSSWHCSPRRRSVRAPARSAPPPLRPGWHRQHPRARPGLCRRVRRLPARQHEGLRYRARCRPTCAPSRAKARTVARPTPAEAPVTTTTLPVFGFRMTSPNTLPPDSCGLPRRSRSFQKKVNSMRGSKSADGISRYSPPMPVGRESPSRHCASPAWDQCRRKGRGAQMRSVWSFRAWLIGMIRQPELDLGSRRVARDSARQLQGSDRRPCDRERSGASANTPNAPIAADLPNPSGRRVSYSPPAGRLRPRSARAAGRSRSRTVPSLRRNGRAIMAGREFVVTAFARQQRPALPRPQFTNGPPSGRCP